MVKAVIPLMKKIETQVLEASLTRINDLGHEMKLTPFDKLGGSISFRDLLKITDTWEA